MVEACLAGALMALVALVGSKVLVVAVDSFEVYHQTLLVLSRGSRSWTFRDSLCRHRVDMLLRSGCFYWHGMDVSLRRRFLPS